MTFARKLRTIVASAGASKHGKDLAAVVDYTNPAPKERSCQKSES